MRLQLLSKDTCSLTIVRGVTDTVSHDDMQAPILAYVGRLAAQKGMDVLLSALPALFNAPQAAEGVAFCSCIAHTSLLSIVVLQANSVVCDQAVAV